MTDPIDRIAEAYGIANRDALREMIATAELIYEGDFLADKLPELARSRERVDRELTTLIDLLEHRPDRRLKHPPPNEPVGLTSVERVAEELGFDTPDADALWGLSRRLDRLRAYLGRLRGAAAGAHDKWKRPKHDKSPHDLYEVMHLLADFWERELNQDFTQDWVGRPKKPKSKAARFVTDVFRLIDPRLGELYTVARNVRAERLRAHRRAT